MVNRLLKRGKDFGRIEDNDEAIWKRIDAFVKMTEPMIHHYQYLAENKVITVRVSSQQ